MCRENTIRITPAKQKSYFTSYLITREMFEKHFDYENPKRAGKKTYIKAINENEKKGAHANEHANGHCIWFGIQHPKT